MTYNVQFSDPWTPDRYHSATLDDLMYHKGCLKDKYEVEVEVARQLDMDSPLESMRGAYDYTPLRFPSSTRASIVGHAYDAVVGLIRARIKVELRTRSVAALERSIKATSVEYRTLYAMQAQTLAALVSLVDL
jgi:hypothetical protein